MSSVTHQEEACSGGFTTHSLASNRRDERGASCALFARGTRPHTSYGVTTAVKTSAESVIRSHLGEMATVCRVRIRWSLNHSEVTVVLRATREKERA